MNVKVKQLFGDALVLSDEDRVQLAILLFESVESTPAHQTQSEWEAVLERRAQELETGAVQPVPWEDVRRRLWEGIGGNAAD